MNNRDAEPGNAFAFGRVVLDTNVLISAYNFGGKPKKILNYALQGKVQVVTSEVIFQEFRRILADKFFWTESQIDWRCSPLLLLVEWVEPLEALSLCRDEADNRVLECAMAGRADYILTGDADLLVLNGRFPFSILRPAEFLDRLESLKK